MAIAKMYNGEVTLKFDGRKHVYTWEEQQWPDGALKIPGVTKILGRLAKEALIPWASGMAADYFRDSLIAGYEDADPDQVISPTIREILEIHKDAKGAYRRKAAAAADVGKLVHAYAESWLKGNRKPEAPKKKLSDEDQEKYNNGITAFRTWWDSHKIEVYSPERMIFSRRWLYAGTTDFFGKIDGELCDLDFKTSSGLYPEMALQVAAYRIALEEELGIHIPASWLVRFDKTSGACVSHRIPRNDMHADAFLSLREVHEKMTRMERGWVVQ